MAIEKVFSYVKDDGKIAIQKLSLRDQIVLLLRNITRDSYAEQKREEAFMRETLTLKADLWELLLGGTESIRQGKHKSVHFKISSKFDPVFKDVISAPRITDYYKVTVRRPELEYDVEHLFDVWLEVL